MHRILVVDDDPEVARLVGLLLDQAGYETWTAHSGQQALECI